MNRKAFTLVELLVVIAIISILAGMLLPTLMQALQSAYQVDCVNNQKQLATGVFNFANDMEDRMPGNLYDWDNTNPMKRDWLRGEFHWDGDYGSANTLSAPQNGTLFPYVEDANVYLCPSITKGPVGDKAYGNGMFDYSIILNFTGIKLNRIPKTIRHSLFGVNEEFDTPMFIEESIKNKINYQSIEGGFNWDDSMTPRHLNKITSARRDGSSAIQEAFFDNYALNYITTQNSKNVWVSVYDVNPNKKFGFWK